MTHIENSKTKLLLSAITSTSLSVNVLVTLSLYLIWPLSTLNKQRLKHWYRIPLKHFKLYVDNVMFVGCETDIHITPDRPTGPFNPGDVFNCSTPSNDGVEQSFVWTDSNGVIVSNTSTTTLTEEGWFNLTCTITDERPQCSNLSVIITGHIIGELIVKRFCTVQYRIAKTINSYGQTLTDNRRLFCRRLASWLQSLVCQCVFWFLCLN